MAASTSRSIWSRVADIASLAATPLAPSHYLELVSPLRATHTRNARIESVKDETANTRTLTLRPGRGWQSHRAGQFIRLSAAVDGRIITRSYSISSSEKRLDARITLTVKAVPGGRMSGFLTRDAKPGDYVTLGAPEGDFVLPDAVPPHLLFVTAGSGVTPVMSMLRTLVARGTMPDAVHVHYAPHERDVIFGAELARIAAEVPGYRFIVVTTQHGVGRRFDRTELDGMVPDWQSREAWACGPQGMLDAIEACFASARRQDSLHVERFRARLLPPDPSASGGRVRFGLSRADVEANGETSLLHVAEGAGVNAPHGCRMGICHTCDVTLVSGCVRDLRTRRRIDEPGTRIQVCVCAAAGDVELAL
jgi:ferredoxin-NADP reductase